MKKVIFASSEGEETRICLLVSGKLVNIDTDGPFGNSITGNIYRGRVSGLSQSLNAAFVDIGTPKEGFLSIQDIHPALLEGRGRHPRIHDVLELGQDLLVQVLRDPVNDKGAMLSTCISLPGRYTVLIPAVEKHGISKKLPEEERQRLRELIARVTIPEGFGVIVRTAGQDRTEEELLGDLNGLIDHWNIIEAAYNGSQGPGLLVSERSVCVRFLREYMTNDISEIIVDSEMLYQQVSSFLASSMPKQRNILKRYEDRLPLFTRYNIETQIEKMFLRDVPLPSGGRIVIDRTEALIAIDVNSGRVKEKDVEDTALKTNVEAAEEIASQISLRDLGGLIVIDFIDMNESKNRNKVQNVLKEFMNQGKAKFSLGRISQFGLLEMTRQRLRPGVIARATETCRSCGGVGYTRTPATSSMTILRRVRDIALSKQADLITVTAPVDVANFLQNNLRSLVWQLEEEQKVKVVILGKSGIYNETIDLANLPDKVERREEKRDERRDERRVEKPTTPAADEAGAQAGQQPKSVVETSESVDARGGRSEERTGQRRGRSRSRRKPTTAAQTTSQEGEQSPATPPVAASEQVRTGGEQVRPGAEQVRQVTPQTAPAQQPSAAAVRNVDSQPVAQQDGAAVATQPQATGEERKGRRRPQRRRGGKERAEGASTETRNAPAKDDRSGVAAPPTGGEREPESRREPQGGRQAAQGPGVAPASAQQGRQMAASPAPVGRSGDSDRGGRPPADQGRGRSDRAQSRRGPDSSRAPQSRQQRESGRQEGSSGSPPPPPLRQPRESGGRQEGSSGSPPPPPLRQPRESGGRQEGSSGSPPTPPFRQPRETGRREDGAAPPAPPRDESATWDRGANDQRGDSKEGLLDSFIKKLLGLDR